MTKANRRPSDAGRAGHDRWLLSYADLVTLLLAVFTTLYAASTVDATKLAQTQSSMREAFDSPPIVETITPRGAIIPPISVVTGQTPQDDLELRLLQELSEALRLQRVDIHRDVRGLVVSLPEEAAFAPASTEVSENAEEVIARVAAAVAPTAAVLRIEGHTDNLPIRTERYASNWELSTARASAVVAHLVEVEGFDPSRLSAAGYGEHHPRVANDTPQNRARNRRIDVVILGAPQPQLK
jgi:chemotaxis protein MotB